SPLPPARTEIAQHTLRLVPALAARAEVTLWTDQPKWDHGLERFGPVRFFDPKNMCWPEVHRGGLSIYNIGNSGEFHGAIWEVSRQHPGLVILHDLSLQHLFAAVYREQHKDRAGYIAVMKRYYGLQGEQSADEYCRGLLSTEFM